jgi:hypothetical protein
MPPDQDLSLATDRQIAIVSFQAGREYRPRHGEALLP